MARNYYLLLLSLSLSPLHAFELNIPALPLPEATVARMSRAQKIGQLFMIGVSATGDASNAGYIETLVREYHVGNIICMQGSAQRHKANTAHLQAIAKEPLLVGMDAEWGPNMRCSDTLSLPKNLALGAICNNHLVYDIGKEIGRQCKSLGVHLNFAPVVDINENVQNPVIGMRSFGDNAFHVSLKANAYMHGLHDAGVLACAKHFPGHGDTTIDSHVGLPVVRHSAQHMHEHDLYPFKRIIEGGALAVMTGHIAAPALDESGLPASLSTTMIRDVLQHELRFRGLVITDGLYMRALYEQYSLPEICVQAIAAGNDMLLVCDSRPIDDTMFTEIVDAIDAIDAAITVGTISEVDLDYHVQKIIELKELIGLYENRFAPDDEPIIEAETRSLKQNLYSDALTLVKNNGALPLQAKQPQALHLQVGPLDETPFSLMLERVCGVNHRAIAATAGHVEVEILTEELEQYKTIIVSLWATSDSPQENWGITPQTLAMLTRLEQEKKQIALVLFGSPYALRNLGAENAILVAYDASIDAQLAAARVVAGLDAPQGVLPVSASTLFHAGISLTW